MRYKRLPKRAANLRQVGDTLTLLQSVLTGEPDDRPDDSNAPTVRVVIEVVVIGIITTLVTDLWQRLLQPTLGLGFMAARAPNPDASVHAVFGIGLP